MTTKIKATNIWKKFNNLEVLKGIDLEVNEGEVVAVIGPSGGGTLPVVARAPCCAASTSWKRLIRAALLSTVKSCAVKPPMARNTSRTTMSVASPAKWAWYSSSSTFFRI